MPLAPLNMISTLHLSVHEMILCTSLFNNRAYHEQAISLSRTEIRAFLCFRIVLLIVNINLTHFVHESSNVWYSYYQTHGYLIIFLISKHILWQNYFTNHKQSLSNAQRAFNFFLQILRYMEDTWTGVLNYSVSFSGFQKNCKDDLISLHGYSWFDTIYYAFPPKIERSEKFYVQTLSQT